MKHKVMSELPMSHIDVKTELERIKERDKELNFRAQKTLDYLQRVVTIDEKKAKQLKSELEKVGGGKLKETQLDKLLDLLPTTERDVKVVLQKYNINIGADVVKKIAETIAEVAK